MKWVAYFDENEGRVIAVQGESKTPPAPGVGVGGTKVEAIKELLARRERMAVQEETSATPCRVAIGAKRARAVITYAALLSAMCEDPQ